MLQKAFDHGQVHALDTCLKDIPEDLDRLFEDILRRDDENLENLKSCLKWILYAYRPLSPKELYFAILSTLSPAPATAWDSEDVTAADINRFILSSSKGLAEPTRSKNPTIQFIHESVRDFLLKDSGSALQADIGLASAGPIHDLLKQSCQRYLISIPMDNIGGFSREHEINFPFLRYSIHNVFKHAESAASLGVPQEKFLEDFPLSNWMLLHDSTEQYKIRRYAGTSLLYILIEKDLLHLFQIEVCRSRSINVRGGRYDFPIFAAVILGNVQMSELLLRYDADHTKSCKQYAHPLHAAVDKLHAPVVAILIKHGAVPAANASFPERLVKHAAQQHEIAIMRLLLERTGRCSDFFSN